MKARKIKDGIFWVGAVDWDRRLFDSLIPLPDGTSYNSYLIYGSEKTVLVDAVDPTMKDVLFSYLNDVKDIDYVIGNHAEQDHSGVIPFVLEKYKNSKLITSSKGKELFIDHLCIKEDRIITVKDGEILSLGNKTLVFIETPWVHWPETMCTYLKEDKILFSCDFFGSHLATSDLYATDKGIVYEAAKRYYAEIMMPFRKIIQKNLEKIKILEIDFIAPSHGPIYDDPSFIIEAYKDWVLSNPKNEVVIPYISMHGSTKIMVDFLVRSLTEKKIKVYQFNLADADIGKLAIALVDAGTLVLGTPTVHIGPHPKAFEAVNLANALRPKLRFISIIGSYGWGTKVAEQTTKLITNLQVEIFEPVFCKGMPREANFTALERLASTIYEKHKENDFA
ncbi:FprA family A-type flavoprotein [bacterium]|nr:FprA family A-type flavoprotein [bacterium]